MACGPYCTFVVGRLQSKAVIEVEEQECREILDGLKKVLLEKGTLFNFFDSIAKNKEGAGANKGDGAGQNANNAGQPNRDDQAGPDNMGGQPGQMLQGAGKDGDADADEYDKQ